LDVRDGTEIWTQSYEEPFRQDPSGSQHGQGPYSTPTLTESSLFTVSITNVLYVWDAETGKLLWKKDYSEAFKNAFPGFGASASPLVWRGLCFVHFGGHDRIKVEDSGKGAMIALNVEDGSERWSWGGDAPAMAASPMIFEIGNRPQLVFKTMDLIVGLDPLTGLELWRLPYEVLMKNTIVTPLVLGDLLVTSDYHLGMKAWNISKENGEWKLETAWRNHRVSLFTNTPILLGKTLIGFSEYRSGQLFGLDAQSGQLEWRGQARMGDHATILSLGQQILVFLDDGSLIIGEVVRNQFQRIRTYKLGRPGMWGFPAVTDKFIFLRDGNVLKAFYFNQPN
jgi:outer membrane protein assembly factor BamB